MDGLVWVPPAVSGYVMAVGVWAAQLVPGHWCP